MNQSDKATSFHKLHIKGTPLVLYNAWDAGSAKTILSAGAQAIATSSWSVAVAQGYQDGEATPLELVEQIAARIVDTVNVPVTLDFEGGYSDDDEVLAQNISRLLDLGIVGINFEDRIVKGTGLYSVEKQAQRIARIRKVADEKGINLFINARTDIFFQGGDPAQLIDKALVRAKAYAESGASGFFIPGLSDQALIGRICAGTDLPVNVMVMEGVPSNDELAKLGVARISYGPTPYLQAMAAITQGAQQALS